MKKAATKSQHPHYLHNSIVVHNHRQSKRKSPLLLATHCIFLMVIGSFRVSSALLVPFQRSRSATARSTIKNMQTALHSSSSSSGNINDTAMDQNSSSNKEGNKPAAEIPRYLNEGLFAVSKPLDWTSQDVVGFLRKMLERDAKERGCIDARTKKRNPWLKVGHGGTLDPLATGVLVVGVGKGTKQLQQYLTGSKGYRAGVELGFQTTTLDMDPTGHVVEEKPYDHVTMEAIEKVVPQFTGKIQQIPPVFSALKRNGKKLYELGRSGQTAEDVQIEPREVQVYRLDLLPTNDDGKGLPPCFGLDVECGGGTYIRSLVRDIGISLDTVATMTSLDRTKQGVFLPEHCLHQEDWTPENIYNSIEKCKSLLDELDDASLKTGPSE
mmetsp:Transcript_14498/g.24011  ORF Transcript_14498/g.24011 Transcript_14498/m.24011 type:complete len:382 (-) Transcript_14498:63-1208(-)